MLMKRITVVPTKSNASEVGMKKVDMDFRTYIFGYKSQQFSKE